MCATSQVGRGAVGPPAGRAGRLHRRHGHVTLRMRGAHASSLHVHVHCVYTAAPAPPPSFRTASALRPLPPPSPQPQPPPLPQVGGAALFSLYIVYDVYMISKRTSPDDYIPAAIELYLDIANLFLHILRILAAFQNDR